MKTQLLLALRILKRRRFFTFISLFGISFTITGIVVVLAMADATLGDNAPLSNRDRLVYATAFRSEEVRPDTSYLIDSAVLAGVMTYDSTMSVNEEVTSDQNSPLGFYLFDRHLRDVDGADAVTFTVPSYSYDTYLDGRKVTFNASLTDAAYWDIFDYSFLAGGPYGEVDVEGGVRKVVLTESSAIEYYGRATADLIGGELPLADSRYEVVGIVHDPPQGMAGVNADMFAPYTTGSASLFDEDYHGQANVIFRAETRGGRNRIKSSLSTIAAGLQALPGNEDRNRFHLEGLTHAEEFAFAYYGGSGKDRDDAYASFFGPVLLLLLMFVLLPALNLANVNVSRVYERSAEIAVRKSFGATDGDILRQFLTETLVITVIGGIIGVLLGLGVVYFMNENQWVEGLRPGFSPEVAGYTLIAIVVFSLVTGLLPAYRMAQTRIAGALR